MRQAAAQDVLQLRGAAGRGQVREAFPPDQVIASLALALEGGLAADQLPQYHAVAAGMSHRGWGMSNRGIVRPMATVG